MSRMIEITRTYTQISAMLQQQHDLHEPQSRNSPTFRRNRKTT